MSDFMQASETTGYNLDNVWNYNVYPSGDVVLIFVNEAMPLVTLSGKYAGAFLKRVGHRFETNCPDCCGRGFNIHPQQGHPMPCMNCDETGGIQK